MLIIHLLSEILPLIRSGRQGNVHLNMGREYTQTLNMLNQSPYASHVVEGRPMPLPYVIWSYIFCRSNTVTIIGH